MQHMSGLPAVPPILHSEPLPLDLLNTNLHLDHRWLDLLDDPATRTDWLMAESDRLATPVPARSAGTAAVAEALKDVRTHVEHAIEPARLGRKPPAPALAGLNAAAAAAPATLHAGWHHGGLTVTPRRQGPLAVRLAACFAEATIELLAGPDIGKVRRCEAPACVILFLATNPRRRWCTPDICGNRARVARFQLRHGTTGPARGGQ